MTTPADLPVRYKQPAEERTITFDMGSKLPMGQSALTSATTFGEAGITVGAASINGRTVSCRVSGGELGTDYQVTARALAANGDTVELDVIIQVRETNA